MRAKKFELLDAVAASYGSEGAPFRGPQAAHRGSGPRLAAKPAHGDCRLGKGPSKRRFTVWAPQG